MTKRDKITILKSLGSLSVASRPELNEACVQHGFTSFSNGYLSKYRVSRGQYDVHAMLSDLGEGAVPASAVAALTGTTEEASAAVSSPEMIVTALPDTNSVESNLVPTKNEGFVRTPNYRLIEKVVRSKQFFPIFITGPSGNGKSLSVIQACANLKRELIRINVTASTDEDDLIGSFRLLNGDTVWQDGPVIEAMKRGAVLLIDEIDMMNPNRAAGLFTALEGNPVFVKKINTVVNPEPGFTILASANTKGKGSDDGRFLGTNILNEAFLERFPITVEFDYPTEDQEFKILEKMFEHLEIENTSENVQFRNALVKWAHTIRKSFDEGVSEELISTRRLVHISKAFAIFGNRKKAITLSIARFDEETKKNFWELYTKIDDTIPVDQVANDSDEGRVTDQY